MMKRPIYISLSLIFAALCCGTATPREPTLGTIAFKSEGSRSARAGASAQSAARGSTESTFDPESLRPYFSQIDDGHAAAALAEDKLDEALALFDEVAASTDDPPLALRARFVAAFLAERLGQNERAVRELPPLASRLPLVADVGWQRAAVAAYRLGRFEEAASYAGRVRLSSVFAGDAVMLRADALVQTKQTAEALGVYDFYMTAFPSGRRRLEAASRAASCLVELAENTPHGDTAARQALSLIQQLKAQAPSSRWTDAAESHEDRIRERLGLERAPVGGNRRAALALYEKGADLMRQMRNDRAEKVFARVIRMDKEASRLWCQAHYDLGRVISRQREHERAALAFSETSAKCFEPDIRVRALYRGGKSFQAAGRPDDAVTMFTTLENEFSTHSYADDARLRAALCRRDQGKHDEFSAMLESLPDDYPSGDMRAEALWTLSLDAIERSDYERAHRALTRYYSLFPKETGWYAAGRSGYWLARIEEQLGLLESAANHYEHVLATAPLSYYMVLAYNRLEHLDAARAQSALTHLSPRSAESKPRFHASLLRKHPELASAIELMRLGLTTLAGKELEHILVNPKLPNEAHWLVAHVLRRMERFEDLRQITELAGDDWKTRYPTGPDFERWCLAYPQAYEDKVAKAAKENAIPKELVWAIMREESSFDPNVESWANAMGLMQLIMPTARALGRRLGIRVNRRTLRRPDVNIALGTAYLGYLKERIDAHPALIIAGYNAGEGAVARWCEDAGGTPLDLFVEQIPYNQTRGYTKRVISTYAVYRFLYSDAPNILRLDLEIP